MLEPLEPRRLLAAELVKDVDDTGGSGVGSTEFFNIGDPLYYMAGDGTHGHELWRSDGTPEGTAMVTDIDPGTSSSITQSTSSFSADGLVYFVARHGTLGTGLWRTDGTADGTRYLAPLSTVRHIASINGATIFGASDLLGRQWIWRSDGTPEGTRGLLPTSLAFAYIGNYVVLDGAVYFQATADGKTHVWKTDGTEQGTVKVMDLPYSTLSMGGYDRWLILESTAGLEAIDVTAAQPTKTLLGSRSQMWLQPNSITSTAMGVFFQVNGGSASQGVWVTDGTSGGTRPLGTAPYAPSQMLAYNGGKFYFMAAGPGYGLELWVTDGTDAGTHMVKDIAPGSASVTPALYSPDGPAWSASGDHLLVAFVMPDKQREVWRTDGTEAGTFKLPIPHGPTYVPYGMFTSVPGGAYIADGRDIWFTDGTIEGTSAADWKSSSHAIYRPDSLGAIGNTLLYSADSETIGRELWKLTSQVPRTFTGTDGDDHWTIGALGGGRIGIWSGTQRQDAPPHAEFTLESLASLTFHGLGGDDAVTVATTIDAPIEFIGGDGTDRLAIVGIGIGAAAAGSWETLYVDGGAFIVRDDLSVESINIESAGSVTLAAVERTTLRTRSLTIGEQAHLDVNDNTLSLEGADLTTIESLLATGRTGNAGITSTAARNNPLMGLATFAIDGDITIKYAYDGDANGDSRINADDYFAIDSGFLEQPANPLYAQGDFNYDDTINADDYFLIDSAFLGQSAVLSAASAIAPGSGAVTQENERRRSKPRDSVFSDSYFNPARHSTGAIDAASGGAVTSRNLTLRSSSARWMTPGCRTSAAASYVPRSIRATPPRPPLIGPS